MAERGEASCEDIERGPHRHRSFNGDDSDGCRRSSDAEEQSWHSPYNANCAASPYAVFRASCASSSGHETDAASETCRNSCFSESSLEIDLESGMTEIKVNLAKVVEKDCRICHLGLQSSACESGVAIELGCSCKGDLASAHRLCAEKWFKIKGNKTCEICGSSAQNVAGAVVDIQTEHTEEWNETNNNSNNAGTGATAVSENMRFWQGHRFLNFLLACMVFAFVISWLFHFNVPG